MYTFIHPTKCGGTALENYFSIHLNKFIIGRGHGNTCKNNNNPIIVIREPIDRFLSMFKYWKRGSETFRPKHAGEPNTQGVKDFISHLKNDSPALNLHNEHYFWKIHCAPTTDWINTDLHNIIAIKYSPNLTSILPELCEMLNLPPQQTEIPYTNVSKKETMNELELDNADLKFIHERYKADFELWDTLCNYPQNFKLVIGNDKL